MSETVVGVLATLNSKEKEALFVCESIAALGARPWLVDLSLRPHGVTGAVVSGGALAEAGGSDWNSLAKMDRSCAAEAMVAGGKRILREACDDGKIEGVIGIGGANGSSMACSLMRGLPPIFPKVMVSPVAATAAVQWYVAESDIVMFPSIGDLSLNRITRSVMENAVGSAVAMARTHADRKERSEESPPLVGVSSFGGTAACVDRVTEKLVGRGYEVIHFHASGPGGKALESLASHGELAGIVDVTTHELADLVVDGVYSSGDGRLRGAGAAALPQVVVPGAIDHSNFWVGMVPECFKGREFFRYNEQNLLMRTNAEEFKALGHLVAERLNDARGPVSVLIPNKGYSEHTKRKTQDLEGNDLGNWAQPDVDDVFALTLKAHLKKGKLIELDLHINDSEFADACVEAFFDMLNA
ncbi:MAG: Tm-1-like ATP-binding domain-containing protein [Nitrospinaceae bacterium]|nr:Tm-1-like ATP-binding domain-containing protein [Nitrospinaceae bacterium]MBT3434529.1 Tm-1-like ATP-binding domain-containing protein [Nitrospinaceae bacterium]MBT4430663.1 Tm-1-like ATP-binding domain-containing protein [Nitrospinaceae bacterium]MBT5368345.1 Tm-1-like ATP-binding domain-containing protein [Nitrospinaceae bacterium]MBT5949063.1 Tm-1-like ATP-binding domain-containing protein [Nitrospinaceae bacterium]